MSPNLKKGILFLFLTAILFSSNIFLGKILVNSIPPFTLAFYRWGSVFVLHMLIFYPKIKLFKNLKKNMPYIAIAGFCAMVISGGIVYLAAQYTNANNMAIVYGTSPLLILLLGKVLFNQEIKKLQLIGVIIGFLGVCVIIFKADINLLINLHFNIGDVLMLAAATSWAIYSLLMKYKVKATNEASQFAILTCCGAFFLSFPVAYENQLGVGINSETWPYLIAIIIFPSFLAFRLYLKTIDLIGPTLTGLTIYIAPIFNAVFAYMFLGETLHNYHIIGALITYFGIFITTRASA